MKQLSEKEHSDYLNQISENAQIFRPYIEGFGKCSYEYGQIAVKNLVYLNGGALIAIPAISQLSSNSLTGLYWPASSFVIGLILGIVAIYFCHLNFLFLYGAVEQQKLKREQEIEKIYFGEPLQRGQSYSETQKKLGRNETLVKITFWGPHILGIISILAFVLGCYLLLAVVQS